MCQKNRVRITRFDKSTMMMIYCVTGIHTTGKKAIISYYSVSVLRQLTPKIGGGVKHVHVKQYISKNRHHLSRRADTFHGTPRSMLPF